MPRQPHPSPKKRLSQNSLPQKPRRKKQSWFLKLRHLTRSLAHELLRPRSQREWCGLAVEIAGWVPGLKALAEVAGASLAVCQRDYLTLGLYATALLTGTGEWMIIIQLIRKGQKLLEVARFSVRVLSHAQRLAQAA